MRVIIRKGREHSLQHGHPWVFSGAVSRVEGEPAAGETVEVVSEGGVMLGMGAWSPESQIRVRMWSFGGSYGVVDGDFLRGRLSAALSLRTKLGLMREEGACRLVSAESDMLPGVIVDRYGKWLVCQFLSCGAEAWKREICQILKELLSPEGIYERSDTAARRKEGLTDSVGVFYGAEPPSAIVIDEGGLSFGVDVRGGHKTGFYLDQRDNREAVELASADAEVLNCFSYTGAFSARALRGGARLVVDMDSSEQALEAALANYRDNGLDLSSTEQICGDVFQELRKFRDRGRSFDVIILDPPKFAEGKGQLPGASRAYKDINMLAFKLLRARGRRVTFSCCGARELELFRKVVAGAALDAGREAVVVRHLYQAADHPVSLAFPEGLYLKGLECFVP